ncbi:molybdate ABC transporter substrate-binding protein [Psychromonas sp.]|uniref:molybdate ABC transporter substrate-binding protein n=1 Tax=Psychromonas sp. TaxID=1884585 RepID=UPI0039E5B72D
MKPLLLSLALLTTEPVHAAINVAVASNFKQTLSEIATLYQRQNEQVILISSASTGTLYNQITHGAPFDLFLSADSERAKLIEASPQGVSGSRFTYANGRLAFWVRNGAAINQQTLLDYKGRLAIANPQLAPYGLAAKQTLLYLHLWEKFSYVQGANISQTYQFIDSGNIDAGFVAYSLLLQHKQNKQTSYYLIPDRWHAPIEQQGVLLANSTQKVKVQQFIDYLRSDSIQLLIHEKGYL